MAKEIIAFCNHKGGVAKTYTTLQVAYELGKRGNKVLVIDGDPQGNATENLGIKKNNVENSLYSLFKADIRDEEFSTKDAILYCENYKAYLLPAEHMEADSLNKFYSELSGAISSDHVLKRIVEQVSMDFDYILIDSAPGITKLTNNILAITTQLVLPSTPEGDSIGGLMDLVKTSALIQKKLNPDLQINGLLFTDVPFNTRMSKWIIDKASENFAKHLYIYKTTIPHTARAGEARQNKVPALVYEADNKTGLAYAEFVDEMLKNLEKED